ncbi:MAG: succinic semialdehyde dehydrogenase [Aeromicrobium sp.]
MSLAVVTATETRTETPTTAELPMSAARIVGLTSQIRTTTHESRTTLSPMDGKPVADIPVSSVDDVQAAFAAARNAQVGWARTPLIERKKALLKLHDLLLENQEELLDLIQLESGKTRAHAFDEIAHVALTARFYARRLHKQLSPQRRSGLFPGLTSVIVNVVPKGVVGIISPWNYPLTMAISDGIPAIAAGNAVVHKPDSQSPLIALAGVELMRKAGIPADLWQVVSGTGPVVGTAIIERADHVCFTGSTATGRKIAKQAAERLISCSLELGGKNPMIVLDSAKVDKAAAGAVNACFSAAGQLCVSIERLYVADAIYDDFRKALVEKVEAMELSSSLEFGPDMGSLVSQSQMDTTKNHVDDAVHNGATVLAGGEARPDLGPFFFEPTVLEGVTQSAQCFGEETFGPLVSLYRFSTEDEAVALANQGEYGLNASIFGNAGRARELAGRITAGTVNINEGFAATFGSLDAPMGGMRQSGLGRRHGSEGILRYTETQSVASQSLLPVSGPKSISTRKYTGIMTFALRFLRRTPRA